MDYKSVDHQTCLREAVGTVEDPTTEDLPLWHGILIGRRVREFVRFFV